LQVKRQVYCFCVEVGKSVHWSSIPFTKKENILINLVSEPNRRHCPIKEKFHIEYGNFAIQPFAWAAEDVITLLQKRWLKVTLFLWSTLLLISGVYLSANFTKSKKQRTKCKPRNLI
jgi:hypothetical protein